MTIKQQNEATTWKIGISNSINPFAPEPPITARADPGPFYPL